MSVPPAWPAALPLHVRRDGYEEAPAMRFASFASDAGPAIERPKGTMRMADTAFPFIMTSAQVEIFEAFVADELAHGTLPFLIEHPRRRCQVTVRMTGEPRYTIRVFASLEWLVSFRARVIG